jgi:drug/metabolite transporter, DME family
MTKNLRGLLFVLISSVFFGSYGVWSRLIGKDFGVFFQGYTRAIIVILILIPIGMMLGSFKKVEKRDRIWFAVMVLFGMFTQAPIFYAYNHMDIGTAILLFYASMLVTMYVVGFTFLREKLTWIKVVSLVLAIAGLLFTFNISLHRFALLAALMAIANGIASGGEVAFTKKVSEGYSTIQISVYVWFGIVVSNVIVSLLIGEPQNLPALTTPWIYQIGYAISGLLAFYFVIEGLRHIESSIGGLAGLTEIVFGIAFGYFMFQELFTPTTLIGMILILTAAAAPHLHDLYVKK